MVVGARYTGVNISETADLLGLSCTNLFGVYRGRPGQEIICSEFTRQKCLVDAGSQRRIARLFPAVRKATVTQKATCCNQDMQKAYLKGTIGNYCCQL